MSSFRYRATGLCLALWAAAEIAAELHPAENSLAVETAAVGIVVGECPVEVARIPVAAGGILVEVERTVAVVEELLVSAQQTAVCPVLELIGYWLAEPMCCLAGL